MAKKEIKYVSFYKSFYDAINELPDSSRLKMYDLIMEYQFFEIYPDENNLEPIEKMAFTLIKPQLDASKKHFKDGSKGGRPRKETMTEETMTNKYY